MNIVLYLDQKNIIDMNKMKHLKVYEQLNRQGRERVQLRGICNREHLEDGLIDGWELIEDEECDFDAEKGFIDHRCIIQRTSDKKFFKVTYTQFGYNGTDLLDKTAVEVERKERKTYYYE